jgi:hypothetical protein
MKELGRDVVIKIVQSSGIPDKKIDKVVGTIIISFARKAADDPERGIILDGSTLSELEDSLRIGADITPSEARKILIGMENTIKTQNDSVIKFLDEGIFEVGKGDLKFRLGK